MTAPRLNQINLVCRDVEASVAFYRKLDLDIPEARIWRTTTGVHHVGAAAGDSAGRLALELDSVRFAQAWNAGWQGRPDVAGRIVLGFELDTRAAVDALFHELTEAGYRGLQAPYDAIWGARYAIIEDPDGLAVGLMSPASPDMRSPPPKV